MLFHGVGLSAEQANPTDSHGYGRLRRFDDGDAESFRECRTEASHAGTTHDDDIRTVNSLQGSSYIYHAFQRAIVVRKFGDPEADGEIGGKPLRDTHGSEITQMTPNR